MSAWIFQGKPDIYPLDSYLLPGNTETWLVSRFRDEMKKGDIVLFWQSGPRQSRGLYGWGITKSQQLSYDENWGYGILIEYKVRFEPHINVSEIEKSNALKDNPLLKMPIGTNFRLTEIEQSKLRELILKKKQISPF